MSTNELVTSELDIDIDLDRSILKRFSTDIFKGLRVI